MSFLLSLLIPVLSLAGCGSEPVWEGDAPGDVLIAPEANNGQPERIPVPGSELPASEGQLLATVETEAEAQALAELYGITLLRYNHPLAVFSTEEDPGQVIARGEANGWPQLSPNDTQYIS